MDAATPATQAPDPAILHTESKKTRRLIIASYWIVILLAVPLWWSTTSIERQSLPTANVLAQQERELVFPVRVHLDTSRYGGVENTILVQEVQRQLDSNRDLSEAQEMRVQILSEPSNGDTYQVSLSRGAREPAVQGRQLSLDVQTDDQSSPTVLAMQLADTIVTLLAPYTAARDSQTERVVKYAPRYRLAFTLLNEDSASGNAALTWDIRASLSKHIAPLLERLSVLHNFTVESQVQYHAPLAFDPQIVYSQDRTEYGLTQEDLTVFVNSAEWTLSSSVSNDPVLHFVLFIPSQQHSPLHILDERGHSIASTAFVLPQWGGIVILNRPSLIVSRHLAASVLDAAFVTFRYQLKALLGVPALPSHVHLADASFDGAGITDWQLDALLRRRAVENVVGTQETLQSIVRLVDQIEGMPVGLDVKSDVLGALNALEKVYAAASASSARAAQSAGAAFSLASRAFFNPGMLALLYFPPEHKYAVYAPLFASSAAPLLAAILREVLAWRRARKARNRGEHQADTTGRQKVE
ncbi:hypothetical protein IEO21_04595 [Rhodonia placenta]|uniref:GPI transamidase component PIG-S n=1 Tax=Rhodonia placenta TaxID=104341 RepID=A0A8H7U2F3_9APHY|nr:hypothetical protein IEO21_04595 [Postia placenta]